MQAPPKNLQMLQRKRALLIETRVISILVDQNKGKWE